MCDEVLLVTRSSCVPALLGRENFHPNMPRSLSMRCCVDFEGDWFGPPKGRRTNVVEDIIPAGLVYPRTSMCLRQGSPKRSRHRQLDY
jgi:hypothetical protein